MGHATKQFSLNSHVDATSSECDGESSAMPTYCKASTTHRGYIRSGNCCFMKFLTNDGKAPCEEGMGTGHPMVMAPTLRR